VKHREGHFTTPDGADIYTQTWLPDDAPSSGVPQAVILIVHGLGEHSGRYGNYVDYFVPRSYALYSFDTRGHQYLGLPHWGKRRPDYPMAGVWGSLNRS
jgi:acylglycerol lipase